MAVRWVSVTEASRQLGVCYRTALALVQDKKLASRLKNPTAKRREYTVSQESIDTYIANHTTHTT